MELVNIGFSTLVNKEKIVSILKPDSAPIRRIIQENKKEGNVIDVTHGRKIRAIIIMDSGHIILSSVNPETIGDKFNK